MSREDGQNEYLGMDALFSACKQEARVGEGQEAEGETAGVGKSTEAGAGGAEVKGRREQSKTGTGWAEEDGKLLGEE